MIFVCYKENWQVKEMVYVYKVSMRLSGFGCLSMRYGLTITDELDWCQHITMVFLRRNLAFAPRHTKEVAYKTLVRPKLEYAAPIWHPYYETQIGQVEKVQRTAARWTCRRWMHTSIVDDMLDELEWPSLETRREQSSLTVFYKIPSGTVSLDKDKYLTPAPNLRRTRASHESRYTRYFAYSDVLKNSFFPRTIPMWNSLTSSVVTSKTIEEGKAQISIIGSEVCVLACLCSASCK